MRSSLNMPYLTMFSFIDLLHANYVYDCFSFSMDKHLVALYYQPCYTLRINSNHSPFNFEKARSVTLTRRSIRCFGGGEEG